MVLGQSTINQLTIVFILLLLQITTLYFVWKIGRVLGTARFWIVIFFALLIIVIRRITTILVIFDIISFGDLTNAIDNIFIPIIFWILMGIGMYDLYQKVKKEQPTKKEKLINKK